MPIADIGRAHTFHSPTHICGVSHDSCVCVCVTGHTPGHAPLSGDLQYISRLIRLARHFVPSAALDPSQVYIYTHTPANFTVLPPLFPQIFVHKQNLFSRKLTFSPIHKNFWLYNYVYVHVQCVCPLLSIKVYRFYVCVCYIEWVPFWYTVSVAV